MFEDFIAGIHKTEEMPTFHAGNSDKTTHIASFLTSDRKSQNSRVMGENDNIFFFAPFILIICEWWREFDFSREHARYQPLSANSGKKGKKE